jgi:hypothetical protein
VLDHDTATIVLQRLGCRNDGEKVELPKIKYGAGYANSSGIGAPCSRMKRGRPRMS